METARIEVGDRQIGVFGELALESDSSLHGIGSAKILIRLVNRLGSGRGCLKIRIGGQHGMAGIEEGGFRDEILVLCRAVQWLLLQEEVGRKAIVEHPKAPAENGIGRFLDPSGDALCYCDTRN